MIEFHPPRADLRKCPEGVRRRVRGRGPVCPLCGCDMFCNHSDTGESTVTQYFRCANGACGETHKHVRTL